MYRVEPTSFGYRITFSGTMTLAEMKEWVQASRKALLAAPKDFGVFVDMRDLAPLAPETTAAMTEGQKLFLTSGMKRSVVIVRSATLAMQFRRLAKQSGIDAFERYINEGDRPDWRQAGEKWLVEAVDPDAVKV